jgi:hypothetical protein
LRSATADATGRFTIAGIGIDRVVELRVRGNGIADTSAWVVNREGFDPKKHNQIEADRFASYNKALDFGPYWLRQLHGPDLVVIAEAERPIKGVVKDIDTSIPRAGVTVSLSRDGKSTLLPRILTATTDAEGRYEIRGAHKAKAYLVEVPSDPSAGFLPCQVLVADTAGYDPIVADIGVKKGVIVTGRVIDSETKSPVPGWAGVKVLSVNPFVKDYPEFGSSASAGSGTEYTVEDGTYRVVTIPGPVVLMGGPDRRRLPDGEIGGYKYKRPVPDPKYPQYFLNAYASTGFHVPGGGFTSLQGNFCKVLDVKPGAKTITQDIILESAAGLAVKIEDRKGRPLSGTWVTGINWAEWYGPLRIEKDACSVYLEPGKPRLMALYEPTRKLIGTLAFKGDEKEPAVVSLDRPGAMKGRLLGEDGKALVGIVVNLHFPERTAAEIHDHIHRAKIVETDSNGAFQIDEVIPGPKFLLWFESGTRTFEPLRKLDDNSVQAGGTLDLGDVKLKRKAAEEN